MPWNDTSKSADKPGPWDRPAGEPAPETREKARLRPTSVDASRPPPSPWTGQAPRTPRRPFSGGPRKPAGAPGAHGPGLDDLVRQLRDRLSLATLRRSGRGVRLGVAAGAALGLLAGWLASGLYIVQSGEVAVVTRFGALQGVVGPGLHYHPPAPIGSAHRLSLQSVNRADLGSSDPNDSAGRLMTRDGDLLGVAYEVRWRVADPRRYVFGVADPQAALRQAARAGMRQAVSVSSLADLLGARHDAVGPRAAVLTQAALDLAGAGIRVEGIDVRDVEPPAVAEAAFHDLSGAVEDAQAARRDADTYRARTLADARADAAKAVQTSQGYRDQEVSEARGEAARFALIDAQYRKAPEVTRERLYTETMERVLHDTPKVVIQAPGAQVVLPPEAFRQKPPPTPAPAATAPQTAAPGAGVADAAAGQDGGSGSIRPTAP